MHAAIEQVDEHKWLKITFSLPQMIKMPAKEGGGEGERGRLAGGYLEVLAWLAKLLGAPLRGAKAHVCHVAVSEWTSSSCAFCNLIGQRSHGWAFLSGSFCVASHHLHSCAAACFLLSETILREAHDGLSKWECSGQAAPSYQQ